MRIFLAVDLDSELRRRLEELGQELRPLIGRARWIRPESLHLTLRFFGETPPEAVETLASGLAQAFEGLPAFTLHFRGCGVFPDRRKPRVLWVGVPEPPPALLSLQSRAESVARSHGFAPERRRFDPHLTVARFREPERGVESILSSVQNRDFGGTQVDEAILFESRLSPEGSSYLRIRGFPLTALEL
ncbi:MAG TPA: RNA 2',3'-cyclic phosphodiesterase [Vicinamibacteria bacterium]|jgi:2'-5' RNA ligase